MHRLLPLLISMVLLNAQTPSNNTAYSVAYVEIAPASRASAIATIKQYSNLSL